jgi:hypothetical protein
MDISFSNRRIGRDSPIFSPILWPSRSLDLNLCDFFVWGHMKQLDIPVNIIEEIQFKMPLRKFVKRGILN